MMISGKQPKGRQQKHYTSAAGPSVFLFFDFDDAVIHFRILSSVHVLPNERHALSHIKFILLEEGVRVFGWADGTAEVVVAYVMSEAVMDGFLEAEHDAAAFVLPAVIILIDGAVAGVGVVGHPILVQAGVHDLIIAEQRILTLPWPDTGCNLSHLVSRFRVDPVIDLTGDAVRHIMLDQRAESIHRRDAVSTGRLHIVVADYETLMSVLPKGRFRELCPLEGCMRIGIPDGDTPAAHSIDEAALDGHVLIAWDTGRFFICRTQRGRVDAPVVHVLVIDITLDIMDREMPQRDAMAYAFIPCDDGDAGPVHLIALGIALT